MGEILPSVRVRVRGNVERISLTVRMGNFVMVGAHFTRLDLK